MPLAEASEDFYLKYKSAVRLEPRCRSDDFTGGIEARTADPLWMLARQWQTGELTGEDAASPLEVRLQYATQTPDGLIHLITSNLHYRFNLKWLETPASL